MAHTKLIESILDGDFVSANELFESRMVELQEKKLYEAKRMVSAQMNEDTPNTKADWAAYRKAHPSLGFYDTPSGTVAPAKKKTSTASKPATKVKAKRKVAPASVPVKSDTKDTAYKVGFAVGRGIKKVGSGISAGLSNIGQQFGAEE